MTDEIVAMDWAEEGELFPLKVIQIDKFDEIPYYPSQDRLPSADLLAEARRNYQREKHGVRSGMSQDEWMYQMGMTDTPPGR